jgi:hypothetical protein
MTRHRRLVSADLAPEDGLSLAPDAPTHAECSQDHGQPGRVCPAHSPVLYAMLVARHRAGT